MSSKPNQKPNTSNELVIFNIDHLIENARKADAPNCAKSNITGKYSRKLRCTITVSGTETVCGKNARRSCHAPWGMRAPHAHSYGRRETGQVPNFRWLTEDVNVLLFAFAENRHYEASVIQMLPMNRLETCFQRRRWGRRSWRSDTQDVFVDGAHGTLFAALFASAGAFLTKQKIHPKWVQSCHFAPILLPNIRACQPARQLPSLLLCPVPMRIMYLLAGYPICGKGSVS